MSYWAKSLPIFLCSLQHGQNQSTDQNIPKGAAKPQHLATPSANSSSSCRCCYCLCQVYWHFGFLSLRTIRQVAKSLASVPNAASPPPAQWQTLVRGLSPTPQAPIASAAAAFKASKTTQLKKVLVWALASCSESLSSVQGFAMPCFWKTD